MICCSVIDEWKLGYNACFLYSGVCLRMYYREFPDWPSLHGENQQLGG